MSIEMHTSGEWNDYHIDDMVTVDGVMRASGDKIRSIHAIRRNEEGQRVTQIVAQVFEQAAHPEQGAANARLIAAAPAMLAALRLLHNDHISRLNNDFDAILPEWALKAISTAIEKAKAA